MLGERRQRISTRFETQPPAALDLKRFGHFNGAITRNGTALGNVVSAETTYANNLDRIETIRSDGRIEVRFADQTLVTRLRNRVRKQGINREIHAFEAKHGLSAAETTRENKSL